MAITVTDLVSEYGAYYNAGGQNEARMRRQLYYGAKTDMFFALIPTDSTRYEMAADSFSRVLQPFQKTWSPTGDYTVTAEPIDLRKIKIDVDLYPDDIERTWLGFLASNNLSRAEWPLIRYVIEGHIIPRHNNDWERNEVFHGQYLAPPTPGTAGVAGTAITGIRKLVNTAYAASTIPAENKISTGALSATATTFVGQIETFCSSMPELIKDQPVIDLAIAGKFKSRWLQGMGEKYNVNYLQLPGDDIYKVYNHDNVNVHFFSSWVNSEKIVATIRGNALKCVKGIENVGNFRIEEEKRLVSIMTDYSAGVGFVRWDQVCTNDRDLSLS